jgi:undecaprenyl-phosphate galactose phosphotransferase
MPFAGEHEAMEYSEKQSRLVTNPVHRGGRGSAGVPAQRSYAELHSTPVDLRLLEGDAAVASEPRGASSRMGERGLAAAGRRIFDIVGAILIGLLFMPFILAVIALIRLGGTPVLFRHRRIGRNGAVFKCLKFRSMVPDAENVLRRLLKEHPELRDEWTENHKLRNDPRITTIGRFLRRTSLDELPQLWNVLRGDMSLVGPRPIVRAELLRYGRQAANYLAVKPGLTGLWQVKGRSDTTYRRRVAMDKYYVRNRSMWMDLYIVAITAAVVLRRAGAY